MVSLSTARLCGDDPVVACVSFDRFPIAESQRREKPDHDMGGGKCLLEQAMLVESGGMAVQWLYTWETWCVRRIFR